MPGIEPTSARNWDQQRPALGTLIFHCHVEIAVLFKLLVPTRWLWSLAWGSSVSVHTGAPFLWVLSYLPKVLPIVQDDGLCWESGTGAHIYAQESRPGARRLLPRVVTHCILDVCHEITCGLGSKLMCNLSELWVEWKRACEHQPWVLSQERYQWDIGQASSTLRAPINKNEGSRQHVSITLTHWHLIL